MIISAYLQQNKDFHLLDIELLLTHTIQRDRAFVVAHPEYRLSNIEHLKLKYNLFKLRQGWSVAHITHHKEFFGLDFYVNKHTLIPRPETEMLVEIALEDIKKEKKEKILIDIGTGSGCIPITITKKIPDTSLTTFATDISPKALRVAHRNAHTHGVNIIFHQGNLLEPVLRHLNNEVIFLTANLPYLTDKQFNNEPSIQKEPYNALVAKNNGLALYEELLGQLKKALGTKRPTLHAYFEIDPSQAEGIKNLIQDYLPTARVIIRNDLAGLPRLACISFIPEPVTSP
jgi:release factor glutamine methyltransferase